MSSALMMERTGMGMPGMGMPGLTTPTVGAPTGMPAAMNWLMVPRCTIKVEKTQGGMRILCSCEDKVATSMVQNLCTMLAGGMCSCVVMMNGLTVCTCNLTMGLCKYEPTEHGVSITCTSGDSHCSEMIQACCDCVSSMLEAGCTCCVLMNYTPVCCGAYESSKVGSGKPKAKSM
jgi:hypothetical protein